MIASNGTATDAFSYLQETSLGQPTQHIILPLRDLDEVRANPACQKRGDHSFCQLALCLSRACLGKYSNF
eukprot:COSAG06_NODE_7119_length_2625_cov_1.685669_4_plen_70_part_00